MNTLKHRFCRYLRDSPLVLLVHEYLETQILSHFCDTFVAIYVILPLFCLFMNTLKHRFCRYLRDSPLVLLVHEYLET